MIGLQVFPAALFVGAPGAGLARVVEIEHRGDGVDAQGVDVEHLQPVDGVGQEHIDHLPTAEVVDGGVPVGLEALAGIGVLIERGSVEVGQAVGVGGKMRRHPVHDHAQAGPVGDVDQSCEAPRIAEPLGRGEQADRLVPPGIVQRVFRHGHEFEMCEPHVHCIGDQALGNLLVGGELAIGSATPRAQVDLIDRYRRATPIPTLPRGQPGLVAPPQVVGAGDDGGRRWAKFGGEPERICLQRQSLSAGAQDLVFIDRAGAELGDEDLPQAAVDAFAQGVAPAIPDVEVAEQRNAPGVRRPDREVHAMGAFMDHRMGAQTLKEPPVCPLHQEIVVEGAQNRPEAEGVVEVPRPAAAFRIEPVGAREARRGPPLEHPAGIARLQADRPGSGRRPGLERLGPRREGPDHHAARYGMRSQNGERIVMIAARDRRHRLRPKAP
jgi:hypothetical protein